MKITVLSTSFGKTFFVWRFILNKNILFWLPISHHKPFVFYVSVFGSQVFTQKLKLRPKDGCTYAISIVNWFFGIFVSENIFFLLFFTEFELLMFYNISEKLNKWNLLKIWLQVTYPAWFGFIFSMGKIEKYLIF